MAKVPKRALKVFAAQFGFYDTVVAVSSQAAALRAWGVHQNLFTDGHARPTEDPAAVKAARAHPGVVLRRAIGSKAPFEIDTISLPDIPKPLRTLCRQARARDPALTKPKPKATRSRLDAAEAALRNLLARRTREEERLARRQDELDRERADAQARFVAGHGEAAAAVEAAREAYRSSLEED